MSSACARLSKIKNLTSLASMQSHGKRLDPSSQRRVEASRTDKNIAFSRYLPAEPTNIVGAWEAAFVALDAKRYGQCAIAAHVLATVSPTCIDAQGDRHDPENPANIALVREAQVWAEQVFGAGSLFAGRLDLDEHGAGVVDLFVMPVRLRQMNGKSERRIITVSGALDELRHACGTKTGFAALQTSWHRHACATIDRRLKRGTPKAETGRKHVSADVYRSVASAIEPEVRATLAANHAREVEEQQEAIARHAAKIRQRSADLALRRQKLDEEIHALDVYRKKLNTAEAAIERRAQDAMREALKAVACGIQAYVAGRIEFTGTSAHGGGKLTFATDMSMVERRELRSTLRTGWHLGLETILLLLRDNGVGGKTNEEDVTNSLRM